MPQPLINLTARKATLFACFLVLYQFLTYIANDMIMPGMIHVVQTFHGQESAVASSLTAYVLGGASLQLFLGPISDCYGRRPVMLTGAVLFFTFTAFIACSTSMEQFLLARFFQGMGLCFIGVVGYATLQEIFAEMDAIRITAILSNVASLAPLLGPLAGAVFILYFNWRGIFVMIGTLSIVALWGLWRFMPESVGAVKKDGEQIPCISLAPKVIAANYKQLLKNLAFMSGALATGVLAVPCIAWIAVSPVIIITEAKLSVIHYALWQLPIFGAGILGNWYLRYLTRYYSVKKIILIGSGLLIAGLFVCYFFMLFSENNFQWLMPGLIFYGFGLGVTAAPLNRFVLFSTPVAKGTAYAMMSMIAMCSQAIGVEVANHVYTTHNNSYFALYCALAGVLYLICLFGACYKLNTETILSLPLETE